MGEKREKRYAIRMSEEEMKIVNEVTQHYNLPNMIRQYIIKLHKEIELYKNIAKEIKNNRP